jgi:phage baseplate assembly protein W
VARDFKSVGTRIGSSDQQRTAAVAPVPVGIVTPLRISESGGFLTMHYSLPDQIADNLRNLILTNHGERVGSYSFGANLRPLSLELARLDWENEAMMRIKEAVERFMPFVDLQSFESSVLEPAANGVGKVAIRLTYRVPQVQETSRALEVIIYVVG